MYNAMMKRYLKKPFRFGTYIASLAALGLFGWFTSVNNHENEDSFNELGISGLLLDNAEADDIGSSGSDSGSSSG